MKRLPSRSASPEASDQKIKISQSEVQTLIEQEVHSAVKKNETKLQDLIETIQQLDRAVNFESSMQTLEARINVVTKRAEEAIAHMTKAQKKRQPSSLGNASEDEAMETTQSNNDKKNLDKNRKFCKMVKTTKEALKKMEADNEALKAAIADLSETPPPVLTTHDSPELKHVRLIKKEPNDEQEMRSKVEEAKQSEEPKHKRMKVEPLSPSPMHKNEHTLLFPPLPDNTFPSVLSMEAASYNIPHRPEVHLALIKNPRAISVLWNINDHDNSAPPMDCYIIYMTMEKVKGSGIFRKWTSLGGLKPLPMPMCVMVKKYKPGLKVCVAVVGKDKFGRYGPYSKIVTAAIPEDDID
ncbi:activating transcription factor 7-interacting protein 2 isoform X2 [Centropristis striata]|nr:activating transcription factor 7-interacting protein 2 isoform X2 [Centropristis striata]